MTCTRTIYNERETLLATNDLLRQILERLPVLRPTEAPTRKPSIRPDIRELVPCGDRLSDARQMLFEKLDGDQDAVARVLSAYGRSGVFNRMDSRELGALLNVAIEEVLGR